MLKLKVKEIKPTGTTISITAICYDDNSPDIVLQTFKASYSPLNENGLEAAINQIKAQFYAYVTHLTDKQIIENAISVIDANITISNDSFLNAKRNKIYLLELQTNRYILKHYSYSRQNTFKAKYSQIVDEITNNITSYTAEQLTSLHTAKGKLLEVQKWIESVLDYFYQKLDEIKNASDLTTLDNITWDFSQFDSTDPQVTIEEIRNILQGVLWA